MRIIIFWFASYRSLCPSIQSAFFHVMALHKQATIIWTYDDKNLLCHIVSLGQTELIDLTEVVVPHWFRMPNWEMGYFMIWIRWCRCACLVTWFCYHLIAKPGNKTGTPLWPDPYNLNVEKWCCENVEKRQKCFLKWSQHWRVCLHVTIFHGGWRVSLHATIFYGGIQITIHAQHSIMFHLIVWAVHYAWACC